MIYTFSCKACNHKDSVMCSVDSRNEVRECPSCSKLEYKRVEVESTGAPLLYSCSVPSIRAVMPSPGDKIN